MGRKFALKAALVVLAVYALTAFGAQSLVGSMLYHPGKGSFREPAGGFRIRGEGGIELSALYLPNPKAKYTLWYFHGNAEDLGNCEPLLRAFHARGFAVFACDYPGYGLSAGEPSEKTIYAANRLAEKYLMEQFGVPRERIVLYGRSLGGGSAVELASSNKYAGLVLESAFTSVFRVMTRWSLLPGDQFKNAKKIGRVNCPVYIMHGCDDRVVPFHHGETLFKRAPEPKRHFWVDTAGHNDVAMTAGEAHWERLRAFIDEL